MVRIDRTMQDDFSCLPPTEVAALPMELTEQEAPSGKWRVLDRMARIVVDQKPDEPCIFSYHYEYKDYLNYYGFIDVSGPNINVWIA